MPTFLGRSDLALSTYEPNGSQRQYGAWLFGAYLEQHFGSDFLRGVWEKRADGLGFADAVDSVARGTESTTYANILADFSGSAYLMDFSDPDNQAAWLPLIDNNGAGRDGTTGSNAIGQARPKIIAPTLPVGVDVGSDDTIEPGGFITFEYAPTVAPGSHLHVDVSVADRMSGEPDVRLKIVRFDHLPDHVCEVYEGVLGIGPEGAGHLSGDFTLSAGAPWCQHVALVFSNTDVNHQGFLDESHKVTVVARLDPPGDLVDDFDRSISTGWGTGDLGAWTTADPTYDQYLSVNGSAGVVNQVAPLANGDITLGVNHNLVNPSVTPIEMVYTFTQNVSPGPTSPFIDDVFYVASDLHLSGPWSAVEIYNSPSNQSATWHIAVGDDRGVDNYVEGTFTPAPFGNSIKLRIRVDGYGTFAKIWMADDPEPGAWTSYQSRNTATDTGWTPSWLVLQPRQTSDTAAGQQFTLEEAQIVSGGGAP